MSGKDQKKAAALEEKLELLRSVTKSSAANETSILVDASKYIKELKDKVSQEPEQLGSTSSSMPMPRSEAAERSVDEQMVRHAVLQAIKKCMDGSSI
ncbi:uncharacterized protein [Oryza sativa Japonica Group]|uniref:Expressed protein n=2 Tax=Oryza sativa subsp. japonica TaxID=39947 RepID=Q2QYP2_ORYSJ|nr:uncharacterized protein LOC4351296 isoform X2 [Oryza sativa Japonica Group]ABA96216.2 expressed protein [Oryza sativa Japonica Group]BAF28986.1 Os12g0111400 [Oryza sativa Japonica Group]BAG88496.1 unnamed protein product [Oryza sativa Japonica Group]BAT15562.1 Os12g0111400 [Oryza sativa Japonica Group]|eukprot:NP_001065967.1 Os12g0111400 [Oryza sativa Japonica Group]